MRIYFLTAAQSPLADRDTTLIDAVRSDLLARPGMEASDSPEEADAIVLHEGYSFKEWRYIESLLADPVVGQYPHKVYTINVDDAANGLLRGIYSSLPRKRLNPLLHRTIPYAFSPNEFVLTGVSEQRVEPAYLATWRGNPKSNMKLRGRLLTLFGPSRRMLVESTDSWLNHGAEEKQHYVELIRSGHFSLCPAGWAAATFRIYESMALGVAPVLIADECVPPEGPDWERISVRVAEQDLPSLEQRLIERAPTAEQMGREARAAWVQYFSPENMTSYYASALLACMQSRSSTDTPAREIRRWRSFGTYWSNDWTLLQRLKIRVQRMLP